MNKLVAVVIAAAITLAAGCGSSDPQSLASQIEELTEKNYPMTDEKKEQLANFTNQGNEALSQGKTEEAVKAFEQAVTILEEAEDTALFNKSE